MSVYEDVGNKMTIYDLCVARNLARIQLSMVVVLLRYSIPVEATTDIHPGVKQV